MNCKIEGCAKPPVTCGMCAMHYSRVRRTGSAHAEKTRAAPSLLPMVCVRCSKEWLATRRGRRTPYCSMDCQTGGLIGDQDLTAGKLRQMLDYDPETGVFIRLVRTSNSVHIGDVFGCVGVSGYVEGALFGKTYRGHRLAFLWMTGEWPKHEVDHMNGIRSDNRWANLRDVLPAENQQNKRRASCSSKTGVLGVWPGKKKGRFVSQIQVGGGERLSIGVFDSIEDASAAYLATKRRLHPCNTL